MALTSLPAAAGPGKVCLDGTTAPAGSVLTACADGSTPIGTYYANSPKLRKFVDTVANLTSAGANAFVGGFPGEYIPIAEPDGASYPGSEYFVIGVVEHLQRMHSDLPKDTTQRSYVQLYPPKSERAAVFGTGTVPIPQPSAYAGFGAPNPGAPVALAYPNGQPIYWPGTQEQVYGYEKAHYLGPIIITFKGTPVRVKFVNFLPNGSATVDIVTDANGLKIKNVIARNGDMFLPTDESLAGAGLSVDQTHKYPQNRVAFHLHGGDSPWISDGTPHQWIAASGENSLHQHGDRFMNTPDMPYPGDGAQTTFWPNDQSNRLMWYHDHTFGLTRQNAYAGAAAGYVIIDQAELDLLTGTPTLGKAIPGGLLDQIVLVVQDKTFVPNDIAIQDAKWDQNAWGKPGDLWYPHVYEPAQIWDKGGKLGPTKPGQLFDPNTNSATPILNPAGRWDYGIDDATGGYRVPNAPLRNDPDYGMVAFPDGTYTGGPSATPESYMDTPVVNGIAYPVLNVEPKAYRVRFLNGANDRYWNLSLWVADSAQTSPDGRTNTEVKMVPADGNAVYKLADGSTVAPSDLRTSGVPDPKTAGPNIIRFANEGGLLQKPVVHTPKPMTGFGDTNNSGPFTLMRDSTGGDFYLGGAERADTVIDFSQYAGKTLILYNDSSAPVPGGDDRYDYYTGGPDQTAAGGAPTTLPGFGPNTRTVMQIRVAATPAGGVAHAAYDPAGNGGPLATELPKAYKASADAHILASGTLPTAVDAIGHSMTLNGKSVPLKVKTIRGITDPNFGRLIAQLGVELPNGDPLGTPLAYIDTPTDIISDGETQYWWVKNNDVDNHPMHFHLFNVQVVARIDQGTGAILPPQSDETGWKETLKNWPLEDVIVAVKPKTPALPFGLPKSVRNLDPTLPVGAVNSSFNRPGLDLVSAFYQNDLVTNQPIAGGVVNSPYDFDWEYVWHCHILGHEENDLMRPLVFHPVPPTIPTTLPGSVAVDATGKVSWTDPTPAGGGSTKGNTANEIGFRVERATVTTTNATGTPTAGVFAALAPTSPVVDARVNTLANATSFKDVPSAFTDYRYRVVAVNEAGSAVSGSIATLSQPPAAPAGLTAAAASTAAIAVGATPAKTTWSLKLNWTDTATNETGYVVQRATGTVNASTGAVTWGLPASKPTATSVLAANLGSYTDGAAGVAANTLYQYQVHAVNGVLAGPLTSVIVATATTLPLPTQMQSGGNSTATTVALQWQPALSALATGYEIQHCVGLAAKCATGVWLPVPGQIKSGTSAVSKVVVTGLVGKTTYQFRVRTINALVPNLYSGWTAPFPAKTL